MPSFTKLFSRKNSSSPSIEKVDNKYETISPPTYDANDSLPTYHAKPAPRRIVLPAEDPMELFARLQKGNARGGLRFATVSKGRA